MTMTRFMVPPGVPTPAGGMPAGRAGRPARYLPGPGVTAVPNLPVRGLPPIQAGVGAVIPAVAGLLTRYGPTALRWAGIGGVGYALGEAGGDQPPGAAVATVAPGAAPSAIGFAPGISPYGITQFNVPEPALGTYMKHWKIRVNATHGSFTVYFWKMWDGYTIMWNPDGQYWKRWKPRKNIVLSSDPRLSSIRKIERAYMSKIRSLAKKSRMLKLERGR